MQNHADNENVVLNFQSACAELQNLQTRTRAEKFILEFKKSATIQACTQILDQSTNPHAKFHVSNALKEVCVREYSTLGKAALHSFRDYLIKYLLDRPQLEFFVREQLLQVVAVICKRGWLEESSNEKESFFNEVVMQLISNSGISARLVGISLLGALIGEFSSDKASAVGLPWDFHFKCRDSFENGGIALKIFSIAIDLCKSCLESNNDNYSLSCFQLLESCLNIEFVHDDLFVGSFECKGGLLIKGDRFLSNPFPSSFRSIVINPEILNICFQAYQHATSKHIESNIPHHIRQCLISLSSIQGPILEEGLSPQDKDTTQRAWSGHYIEHFVVLLKKYNSTSKPINYDDQELICLTDIIRRLFTNNTVRIIASTPSFFDLLNEICTLTTNCLVKIVENSSTQDDDSLNMIALEELLGMWSSLISKSLLFAHDNQQPSTQSLISLLSEFGTTLFKRYVDARLNLVRFSVLNEMTEEFEGDGFKDADIYEDQLLNVAVLARLDPASATGLLNGLLKERLATLSVAYGQPQSQTDSTYMAVLHEHIHWLVLISGFVLCDAGAGESPVIPENILAASNNDQQEDSIVGLTNTIFEISNTISVENDSQTFMLCSPLLAETIFWFFGRWSRSYLFLSRSDYGVIGQNLVQAFSIEGNGKHVLEFILDKVHKNLILWHGDEDVLLSIINLLDSLSKVVSVRDSLLSSQQFSTIVQFCLNSLNQLPSNTHSPLIQAFTIISSTTTSQSLKKMFLDGIIEAIESSYRSKIFNPNFQKIHQSVETVNQVLNSMECFSGLALAIDMTNVVFMFNNVFVKWSDSFITLFDLYKDFNEVETSILAFYDNFIQYLTMDELSLQDIQSLNKNLISLLQVFGKNNTKKTSNAALIQEELAEYISTFLKILINLTVLSNERAGQGDINSLTPNTSSVVFFGVNVLIPLITSEMLTMTPLCSNYIKLVSLLVTKFPSKLSALDQSLVSKLISSLKFGMESTSPEISKISFEATSTLSSYLAYHNVEGNAVLYPHIDGVLEFLLNLVLFKEFDSKLFDEVGEALFWLIMLRNTHYLNLISQLCNQTQHQQRLSNAFTEFNAAVQEVTKDNSKIESAHKNPVYKDGLMKFLMYVRGFLRIK